MHFRLFIHSFIFNNHFILLRVMVDPKPILGILGTRWKYTLEGMPHIHTLIHTWGKFSKASRPTDKVLEIGRAAENLQGTHMNMARTWAQDQTREHGAVSWQHISQILCYLGWSSFTRWWGCRADVCACTGDISLLSMSGRSSISGMAGSAFFWTFR